MPMTEQPMTAKQRRRYEAWQPINPSLGERTGTVVQVVVLLFAAFIAICFVLGILAGGN